MQISRMNKKVWVQLTAKVEQTPPAETLKTVLVAAPAGLEICNTKTLDLRLG